jgi:biopolymer transport protein ExbB/TolQ
MAVTILAVFYFRRSVLLSFLPLAAGIIGTVLGLMVTFSAMVRSGQKVEPIALANQMDVVLTPTNIGMGATVVCLFAAIIRSKRAQNRASPPKN